ncbi:unnamed protein product [Musa banksii]
MFAKENPDLQKKIGCATGILQMFDRHHFLTGRHLNDHNHKKLLSGYGLQSSRESEQTACFSQILQEKKLSKNLKGNRRVPMESSLASFSSSSSSSFSSHEYKKSSQREAFDRTFFPERSLENSPMFRNSQRRLSMDSQDYCKSAARLREIPRLSLESRESLLRSSNFGTETSLFLGDLDRTKTTPRVSKASDLLQDRSRQVRHPSVVAKLMGLDKMPELNPAAAIRDCVPFHEPRPKGTRDARSDQSPRSVQSRDLNLDRLLKLNSSIMTDQMQQQTEPIYKRAEGRIKDKDLRALKQMVHAMREKRLAQAKKRNGHTCKTSPPEDDADRPPTRSNPNPRSPKARKQPAKAGGAPKSLEPPIAIMKSEMSPGARDSVLLEGPPTPAKLRTSSTDDRRRASANNHGDRDHTPRVRLRETDKQFNRRATLRSNQTQGISKSQQSLGTTLNPKLQQRRKEAEKKSCPPTPYLSKAQAQSTNKQTLESVSPRSKPRLKQSQVRKNKDQIDDRIRETRGLRCRDDEVSPCSYKSRCSALQSAVLQQHIESPSSRAAHNPALVLNQTELTNIDAMHNPDHKYVTEMLLATGFLNKDFRFGQASSVPFQRLSSDQAINPDLFSVLEQPKHGCPSNHDRRNHRKLVFDVVNEILAHKMESFSNGLLQTRKPSGQHLLAELCSEIERLQAESTRSTSSEDDVNYISGKEVLHRSEWVDFDMEQPRVALEIEKLISEDLIHETVSDATEAVLRVKTGKLRRQQSAQ